MIFKDGLQPVTEKGKLNAAVVDTILESNIRF